MYSFEPDSVSSLSIKSWVEILRQVVKSVCVEILVLLKFMQDKEPGGQSLGLRWTSWQLLFWLSHDLWDLLSFCVVWVTS